MCGRGVKNCRSFSMCLNLNDYQFKRSKYSFMSTYVNSMVITNQISTTETQKLERKEHKHTLNKTIKPQGKKQKGEMNRERTTKTNKKVIKW